MTSHQVQLLFIDLGLILLLARLLGHLAARFNQPAVVGEILAGILLGPTLFSGVVSETLFPSDIRPLLTAMADLGVALFMFTVGMELERATLRGRSRVTGGAIVGSTVAPFLLGIGLAFYLLRTHEARHTAAFVVFIGLSVSVTAFPVLARILTERGLSRTALGGIALTTAASVDVVAWTALAAVQAAAGGGGSHWRVALCVPYVLVMMLAVRPLLRAVFVKNGEGVPFAPWHLAMVLIGVLLSAAATEAMGMHFIFGAFLFGAIMPREKTTVLRTEIEDRTGQVTSLLLPVYFVVAGLKVDLGALRAGELLELGVILVVAVAGKFGGTYLGARSQGLPARPATALGVLMNTRGLTELVILGVGLQLGLLDTSLYSLMVVMAVVTTAMTGPLLSRIYTKPVEVPRVPRSADPEPAASSSA
ncbi:sodium:proton exchanger [Streptomyces agglomeratus]|uniref:Sodium:proton exchanger n=1 Tax=Streptomyces agglomeratus TaxID=285458 RepID=A0A1E5PEP2_9ACTN|nr:cation:proton antiporter [Streptomyces agglomeratus]OEJ27997.1 sodium:proton exchanger [Streptomyces agglomeratus]OEJ37942.1 sodium:proton exchanger [Streptomyces agglomeratus]OEJ47676.1 sodium:proton exchanger [Streptomyces agglomeratus]OEJ50470.1 sodium:proton exchanger [Streptomyces agglomeratus]OEJ57822.1 sodium:proton exchanger [Streptomyces agglomeratus]